MLLVVVASLVFELNFTIIISCPLPQIALNL